MNALWYLVPIGGLVLICWAVSGWRGWQRRADEEEVDEELR